MKLKLEPSSCVRYSSKFSNCKECEEICFEDAIKCSEGSLTIFQDRCISCGGCVGVCPTEALQLSSFSVKEFFFDFIKKDERIISCKSNFVCLSAFNVEYLISLALIKDIVLDLGHCLECSLKEPLFKRIEDLIKESNLILSTISDKKIKTKMIKETLQKEDKKVNRRELFRLFSPDGVSQNAQKLKEKALSLQNPTVALSNEQSAKKREKIIPDKRKLFFSVLKRIQKPKEYQKIKSEDISFTSSKEIDNSCDNCSICYRVCPSGALSSNAKGNVIFFDDMLCLKCRLCHDVCEKDSIKMKEFFDTKEFFEPTQTPLIRFNVIRCNECGNFFTYQGGEKVCKRCKIQEEEALNLWGFDKI